MIEKTFTIIDEDGIHAQPAAILVSNISRFASEIILVHNEKPVNLKSIKSLMALEIRKGDRIKIFADGLDEEQAILEVEAVLKIASLVS
nr:HPr family phosphocarrier protein [Neobacillus sp. Marseille-Q6967]